MILSDIRNYLQQRGQASLSDIAMHFDTPPEAVKGMLEIWIRKGRVRRHLAHPSCGSSCSQCAPTSTEIYQWMGSGSYQPGERVLPLPGFCKQ